MALTRDAVFWNSFTTHARCTVRAAVLLGEMIAQPAEAERLAREIKELENEGDKITHDTVLALHQTWITPLDREEIHELISKLDDVLDYIESASERFALYEIREVTPEARELARVLIAAANDVAMAVAALPGLKQAQQLLDLCVSINQRENEADGIFRRGLARLFKEQKDPLLVMKWRDVYDALETATDRAEDVANIIEGIVLEHA
jgi:hypothetical protein